METNMEKTLKKSQGVTLTGFIFFAFAVCLLGVFFMRVTPVYIQHYQVLHAAKSLKELPKDDLSGPPTQVRQLLYSKLLNQLYVNMIETVKAKNINVLYKRDKYIITIKYQEERPLFYNIHLKFYFDSQVEVPIRGK